MWFHKLPASASNNNEKNSYKVLGSKTLGLNVLEVHYVMLANQDQNVYSCFRLAQSMFILKLESNNCRKLPFNFYKAQLIKN